MELRVFKAGGGSSSLRAWYVDTDLKKRTSRYADSVEITGVIGILTLIFLVDFPDRAHKSWKFLSEKECAFIVRRINRDRSDGDNEPFNLKKFLLPALDLKIWGFAVIFL